MRCSLGMSISVMMFGATDSDTMTWAFKEDSNAQGCINGTWKDSIEETMRENED